MRLVPVVSANVVFHGRVVDREQAVCPLAREDGVACRGLASRLSRYSERLVFVSWVNVGADRGRFCLELLVPGVVETVVVFEERIRHVADERCRRPARRCTVGCFLRGPSCLLRYGVWARGGYSERKVSSVLASAVFKNHRVFNYYGVSRVLYYCEGVRLTRAKFVGPALERKVQRTCFAGDRVVTAVAVGIQCSIVVAFTRGIDPSVRQVFSVQVAFQPKVFGWEGNVGYSLRVARGPEDFPVVCPVTWDVVRATIRDWPFP